MTCKETLERDVKAYAKTLADVVSGNDAFAELAEGADINEYDFDLEYDRLRWYFEDVLDVEYRVDSRLEYKGTNITLSWGGPGIEFNTRNGEVKGYWGNDEFDWRVDYYTRHAIDSHFAEVFYMIRESY